MSEPPHSQPEPPTQPQGPYPPQPASPYSPQEGSAYPPPGSGYPPFQPGQAPFEPAPPRKSGAGKIVAIIAGVLVALLCCCVVGVAALWNSDFGTSFRDGFTEEINSNPENAKVGDCLTKTVKEDASDAKVVDCAKPEAANKVIGIIPNVTEQNFDANNQTICEDDFPEWENVLWFGRAGGTGKVLCVAPNG